MKTEEDEAFDDLARRQGAWGGGFQAKRAAAADKLQDGKCKYCVDGCAACDARAQPAQEPVAWMTPDGEGFRIRFSPPTSEVPLGWDALYTTPPKPAQEPVARVSGTYGGRFVYDPINPAAILPIGMALYAAPPQREWVGLTDAEIHDTPGYNETREMYLFALTLIAKLQEKNNGP